MDNYLVKQPIHDEKNQTWAYEVLYNDDSFGDPDTSDYLAASAIENLLMQINNDGYLENKTAFITFTPNLLMRNAGVRASVEYFLSHKETQTPDPEFDAFCDRVVKLVESWK